MLPNSSANIMYAVFFRQISVYVHKQLRYMNINMFSYGFLEHNANIIIYNITKSKNV